MATLKDHQQAMVDLLASGSGIPASASRLAHAMHDVLSAVLLNAPLSTDAPQGPKRLDAATPGLNDRALAADVEACQIKPTGNGGGTKADLFDRARAAERRVKELENTVKQLRASRAKQKAYADAVTAERDMYKLRCGYLGSEQAGCRKDDTQVCEHDFHWVDGSSYLRQCTKCGSKT